MLFKKRSKRQMSDAFITATFIILSGGFQDAYTYCNRGKVFANGQTGNLVLMSAHLFRSEFTDGLRYLIPISFFLIGTSVAENVHYHLKNNKKIHWRQIILIIEIFLLFGVGFIPQEFNYIANATVSFVCALQVHSFRKLSGHAYASTMCVGNMCHGVEALNAYFHSRNREILKKAGVYFFVIFVFSIGAGIGSVITRKYGELSIWVSCILLLISFIIMFIEEEEKEKNG